jgi:hypothetical protein
MTAIENSPGRKKGSGLKAAAFRLFCSLRSPWLTLTDLNRSDTFSGTI